MTPKAMIVEDDDGMRLIYQHVLGSQGFEVLEAADGQQAMDLLEEHTPDLLFLDVRLPFISGLDILDYMRDGDRFHQTYIVVASSSHHPHGAITGRQVEFVLKPIRPAQIRDIASRVLA